MKGKGSMQASKNAGARKIKTSGTVTRNPVAKSKGGVPLRGK